MSATVTNILNITSILVLLSLFGFGADQGEMHHCDRALMRCRTPCERKYSRRGAIIDPLLRASFFSGWIQIRFSVETCPRTRPACNGPRCADVGRLRLNDVSSPPPLEPGRHA